jgi:hypothetical protein
MRTGYTDTHVHKYRDTCTYAIYVYCIYTALFLYKMEVRDAQSDQKFGRRRGLVTPIAGIEGSGLRPSEKELPGRRSSAFRHKILVHIHISFWFIRQAS